VVQQGELDELEREEFFRLKKVQAKKKRDAADKDAAVIEVSRKLVVIGSWMCTASLHCPRPDKVPTSGLAAYALFAQDNAAVNRFYIRHAVLRTDNDCKGRPALHLISYFELREVLLTWYVYCVSAAEAATKQGVKYWHLLQDNVKAASSLSDVSSNVLKTDDQDEDIVFWQLVCRAAYIDFPGLVHASLFAGRWVDAASDLSSNTFFLQNYMIRVEKLAGWIWNWRKPLSNAREDIN